MTNIKRIAKQFLLREEGQDLIEYALVAAVISMGCVAVLAPVAEAVGKLLASVTAALNTVA